MKSVQLGQPGWRIYKLNGAYSWNYEGGEDIVITISSGGASPLFMAGHRQVISRISKGSHINL